jgi:hypothetical protein
MIEPSGSVPSPAFPPSLLALPVDAKVKILAPRMIGQWHAGGLSVQGPMVIFRVKQKGLLISTQNEAFSGVPPPYHRYSSPMHVSSSSNLYPPA